MATPVLRTTPSNLAMRLPLHSRECATPAVREVGPVLLLLVFAGPAALYCMSSNKQASSPYLQGAMGDHGISGQADVATQSVLGLLVGRLLVGAATVVILIALRQVLLRFGRLAFAFAIVAPTSWYMVATRPQSHAPSNSTGLYTNAIDAHGMSGPVAWYLSQAGPAAHESRGLYEDAIDVIGMGGPADRFLASTRHPSNASSGLHSAYAEDLDAHGVSRHKEEDATGTLSLLGSKLIVAALVVPIFAAIHQVLLRFGRAALLFAILAPVSVYFMAAQPERPAPVEAQRLYQGSIDVHGVGGPVDPRASSQLLAITCGRLLVAAVIITISSAMHAVLLRFDRAASLLVLAAPASLCLLLMRFALPLGSAPDSDLYTGSIDVHGTSGQSEQETSTLLILTGRLALGIAMILMCALMRRVFSRLAPARAPLRSQADTTSLPIATGRLARRSSLGDGSTAAVFSMLRRLDIPLVICFAVWYYGNYEHNISNKLALRATGGAEGFPLTIATCQLGVGVMYAVFLWIAPDSRPCPTITVQDWKATLPLAFVTACAHGASVFALSAGALSFTQIVKSCEPAFAALIGTLLYGSKVSSARWLCLIPIIGGVALSALVELDFAWAALFAATVANISAAVRSNENKRLLATDGIKDRLGSVGNQYAITTINAFFMLLPLALFREGSKLPEFIELCRSNKDIFWNVVLSGWWFYIYNEVATIIINKTSAVTQSIANTAKRAVVIVLGAIVMGESLGALKLVGCTVAIGGVFLYSQVDDLVKRRTLRRTSAVPTSAKELVCERRLSIDTMVFVTPEKPKSARDRLESVSTAASCSPLESRESTLTGRDSSTSPQPSIDEVSFTPEAGVNGGA